MFLVAFSFVAIKFGNGISNNMKVESWSEEVEEVAEDECTTCGSLTVEEQVFVEEMSNILEMTDGLVDITKLMEGDEEELALFQSMVEESGDVEGIWDDFLAFLDKLAEFLALFERQWTNIQNFATCSNFSNQLNIESAVQLCDNKQSASYRFSGLETDQGDSFSIPTNARVVFSEVTYPLAYFLGQYVYENSKREISYRSTEYSSSGEMIDIDYQAKTLPPGDAELFKEDIENLETEREPFSIKASLSLSAQGAVVEKEGEVDVDLQIDNPTDADGPCPFAKHDYNPETANYIAYHEKYGGYLRSQVPGGNNYELPEDNECYKEGSHFFRSLSGNVPACINMFEWIIGRFKGNVSKEDWDECTKGVCETITLPGGGTKELCTPNPEKCVDIANIGIKMPPLLGKPYECNEPVGDGTDRLCANAFLTESYKGTLSPERASEKKVGGDPDNNGIMYFIATPCKLRVTTQGEGSIKRKSVTVPVTCLWDATSNNLTYQLQAKDRVPGQEDFPQNFRSYWNGVLQAIRVSAKKDKYNLP